MSALGGEVGEAEEWMMNIYMKEAREDREAKKRKVMKLYSAVKRKMNKLVRGCAQR